MRLIGIVKQVQVQRSSLKVGERPYQSYDPAPLLAVDSLEVSPLGVIGCLADGARIVDVHHARHPVSRSSGANGISVGFTAHYRAMRERFGAHMVEGIAGENILIEAAAHFTLAHLIGGLVIQSSGAAVQLSDLLAAPPCVPFAHFVHQAHPGGLAAEVIKETLQFLGEGMRGFYAAGRMSGIVAPGDRVYVLET